jgi:hypothetical protein
MKNKYILLLTFFAFFIPTIQAVCDEKTKKEFRNDLNKSPHSIYLAIQKKFHTIVKVGFNDEKFFDALDEWDSYVSCANNFVQIVIGTPDVPAKYGIYIQNLQKIRNFISDSVAALQESSNPPTPDDLERMKKHVIANIKKVELIFAASIQAINKSDVRPVKRAIEESLTQIFPAYEKFFRNYYSVIAKGPLSDDGMRYFLSVQQLVQLNPKDSNKEKASIANFIDLLEKFKAQAEEEKKKTWFGKSELQKKINASNEIIDSLIRKYPTIITTQMVRKIPLSMNQAALIIAAESGSLFDLLSLLQKHLEKVVPLTSVVIKKGSY